MSNKFLGEHKVRVDDKDYTLRLDMNALCIFEDLAKCSAMVAIDDFSKGNLSNIRVLRTLILAALSEYHPDATEKEAGNILSSDLGVLMHLIEAASPDAAEGEKQLGK